MRIKQTHCQNRTAINHEQISWLNKKQLSVVLSTTEAEYVALRLATQESVWLKRMLADLYTESKSHS